MFISPTTNIHPKIATLWSGFFVYIPLILYICSYGAFAGTNI